MLFSLIDWWRRPEKRAPICLKTTLAYERTLQFENVTKAQANKVFGRPRKDLTSEEIKQFEDFIMWRLVELSAKHDLPFQIHTGQARIQGSNPMLLVDLIQDNPKTKFILFHGGFPWVGETGVIAMRFHNVWIDSCWLPTLSYTMAKRAYTEWLEVCPSNRIMWGSDTGTAEGIYGRDGIYPPMPGRSVIGKGRPRRVTGRARAPDRQTDHARKCVGAVPATTR